MYKQNYDAKEFGNRVRMIRKQANMTQEVLAEKLYVSVDTVSKIENGRIMCMPEHLVHICELFNVSADYLYFGKSNGQNIDNKATKICDIMNILHDCDAEDVERISQMISLFLKK